MEATREPTTRPKTRGTARARMAPPVRVLVVFEFQYRSYGQAIAGAIRALRPGVEVAIVRTPDLGAELTRVSPHLVISSRPSTVPERTPAWVEVPNEPGVAGSICFDGRCSEARDLMLEDLLQVVDRTEELVGA